MSKIKKGITFIVLLITSICFSQNDCVDFKDYEESQDWIKKVNSLNPEEKKSEILKRIDCENNLKVKSYFKLLLIINGLPFNSISISKKAIHVIEKIETQNYVFRHSNCENKENSFCVCHLGILIINNINNPIMNEIKEVNFKTIKRKKNRIKITIFSDVKSEVNLKIDPFTNSNSSIENRKIKLKKGKNKIKFKTDNYLNIIELEQNNLKLIIFK
jgi:hypothetical protein